jgi:PKD repeat protein
MIKMRNAFRTLILLSTSLLLNDCGKDSFPVPPASTVPLFSFTLTNDGYAPSTVTFTNESIVPEEAGDPYYTWDFGDGTGSEEASPEHAYAAPGVYEVQLVVKTSVSMEIKELTQNILIKNANASGTPVYFTNGTQVFTGLLNEDPPVFSLLPVGPFKDSYGLAIDTVNSKLYISDEGTNKIFQCDLDGKNIKELRSGLDLPDGLAYDYATGTLYWDTLDGIEKGDVNNTSTSQKEVFASGQTALDPEGVSFDPAHNKVYWTNYEDGGGVWSKNADGSGESMIISGVAGGSTLVVGNRLYFDQWVATGDIHLKSANLDGTGISTITTGISKVVFALGYDPDGNKIYWGDRSIGTEKIGRIMRSDPDGSNIEIWYESAGSSPRGIVFGKKINKANTK